MSATKWIMGGWTRTGLYRVNREDGSRVAWFSDKADAALAVSAVNAGGEPVAYAIYNDTNHLPGDSSLTDVCLTMDEVEGSLELWPNCRAAMRVVPLYAAPVVPRPEPAGEVEWRVDEAMLTEDWLSSYTSSNRQNAHIAALSRDLRDARTALARRPEQWRRAWLAGRDAAAAACIYANGDVCRDTIGALLPPAPAAEEAGGREA